MNEARLVKAPAVVEFYLKLSHLLIFNFWLRDSLHDQRETKWGIVLFPYSPPNPRFDSGRHYNMAPSSTHLTWRDLHEVLKPCNPNLEHTKLPELDISDVSLVDKSGNPTSLLLANEDNPLTITGHLAYSKAVAKRCKFQDTSLTG
jgi:hypothetical protein